MILKLLNELRHARATQDYRVQYTDPIRVFSGEVVHVGHEDTDDRGWWWCSPAHGRQGWAPVDLAPARTAGEMAHLLADYEATELPLHRGEALVVEQQRGESRAAQLGTRLTCGAARAPEPAA